MTAVWNGAAQYDHVDALGSVTSLTDASGGLRSAFRYASYGTTTSSSDQVGEPYGYVGQTTLAAAGLDALGARFYDPVTGRFLSTDPLGTIGGSTYVYAGDNPVAYTDPSGRSPCVAYCGRSGSWDGVTDPTTVATCARYCGHDGAGTNGGSEVTNGGGGSAAPSPVIAYLDRCGAEAAVFVLGVALSVLGACFMYTMLEANMIQDFETGLVATEGGGAASGVSLALDTGAIVQHWNDPWAVAGAIVDILSWVLWTLVVPNSGWVEDAVLTAEFGGELTPVGWTVLAGSVIASTFIGYEALSSAGCGW